MNYKFAHWTLWHILLVCIYDQGKGREGIPPYTYHPSGFDAWKQHRGLRCPAPSLTLLIGGSSAESGRSILLADQGSTGASAAGFRRDFSRTLHLHDLLT